MENKDFINQWPAQLRESFEHFKDVPGELLQDSLNTLSEAYRPTILTYQTVIEGLVDKSNVILVPKPGPDEKHQDCIEEFLADIHAFLQTPDTIPLKKVVEQLVDEVNKHFDESSLGKNEVYSKHLDQEYWKSIAAHSMAEKAIKSIAYSKLKFNKIMPWKKKGTNDVFGLQKYHPDLLLYYFYAVPLIEFIYSIIGEFLLMLARSLNALHLSNEAFLGKIISLVQSNIYSPADIKIQLNEAIKEYYTESMKQQPYAAAFIELQNELKDRLDKFAAAQTNILDSVSKKAGTKMLPETQFSSEKSQARIQQILLLSENHEQQWVSYFKGEKDDWFKDLQLLTLNHASLIICIKARDQLSSRISKNVLPAIHQVSDSIQASIKLFSEQASGASEDLKENILQESRLRLRKLRREQIPLAIDQLNQAAIPKIFNNTISQLKYKIGSFQEEYAILQEANLDKKPPVVKIESISLKKIIEKEYLPIFSTNFLSLSENAESFLHAQLRTLNEIGQIIEFNIETALEILDDKNDDSGDSDARLIVSEGLERANNILTKAYTELANAPAQWSALIIEMFVKLNGGIDELLENNNILNLQIREARAEASTKFRRFQQVVSDKVKLYLRFSWNWLSYGLTGAKSGYNQIHRLTGKSTLPELERALMDLLFTTRNKIEKLPFVYQRLYRFEALADNVLFGGRDREVEIIKNNYTLWKSDNFANTVVIGEKGSGRTSLLNLAAKSIGITNPLFRININKNIDQESELLSLITDNFKLDNCSTIEELVPQINKLEAGVICIVEDLHFLFLRTIDGIDLVEKFLLLISQTQSKVFWIVSIGSYSWSFLDRVISIDRYFHHLIFLSQLEEEQIREIILKRHRISGYGLEFLPDDSLANDRKYKKIHDFEAQQAFLDKAFFKELHQITQGNISVAFLLWQLSVEEFKKDKVLIRSNLILETSFLNDLPEDELFMLEALLEHEILTIEEHSVIFRETEEYSSQLLNRMRNKGLLVETQSGYQLHYMLYKAVVRTMKSKNILK